MTFYDRYRLYSDTRDSDLIASRTEKHVLKALRGDITGPEALAALLSPAAAAHLEEMARTARSLTLANFGRTMQLYTPVYISDFCDNSCSYCGFNADNRIRRRKLNREEIEREAEFIASTGLRNVLVLTGGSRRKSPVQYIARSVSELTGYFSSVSAEIYACTSDEYGQLIDSGADGLTLYQETYDEDVYASVHLKGRKRDFRFRLEAPERAAERGMRTLNIGALLGLTSWRGEAFMTGLHAEYLEKRFPSAEISVSVPRLRPYAGRLPGQVEVFDADIVQIVTALRIFSPRLGITLSTREDPVFRGHLMPLGITRMSAGSTTAVGGHTSAGGDTCQFEIADRRDVAEIKSLLRRKGYQPVLKDWVGI
jgi:2-iminoacetate synthase